MQDLAQYLFVVMNVQKGYFDLCHQLQLLKSVNKTLQSLELSALRVVGS
jgi:hypothetical protein